MGVILLPLLQGAGAVALAVVAFSLAFTWPSLVGPIQELRSERARLLAFSGLGLVLVLSAAVVYLTPGLLLRDELGLVLALPVGAMWLIATVALVIRGLVLRGVARAISAAFAVVSFCGVVAGIVSAVCAQHRIADTITPTGAFVLVVGAVAGIVFWSKTDGRQVASAGSGRPPRHFRETQSTP